METKYIALHRDIKKRLEREFNVSHVTIWSALNYITKSTLSTNIRKAAIKYGGVVVNGRTPEGWQPNCEIKWEHKDNKPYESIQTFSNGIKLRLNWQSGKADIMHQDEVIETHKLMMMTEWHNILYRAQIMNDTYNS